ncbi:MAG TPA: hypothetical protein VGD67_17840, partial [Pseudonocardiaceae bacterium]
MTPSRHRPVLAGALTATATALGVALAGLAGAAPPPDAATDVGAGVAAAGVVRYADHPRAIDGAYVVVLRDRAATAASVSGAARELAAA